jgi:O-antigen ligase
VDFIKTLTLFIFVFFSFNSAIADNYVGAFAIKAAFGLFLITHIKELSNAFFMPKTPVIKAFFIFIATIIIITVITYLLKSNEVIYMSDMPVVTVMRILSFVTIILYVTYTDKFKELLYMIWISMVISSIIAANSEPVERWTFRRVGGVDDPNDFAAQLLLSLFITYYLFKQNGSKIFLLGSYALFIYTLLYAGSKSSFLVLFIIGVFIFIVKFKEVLAFLVTLKGLFTVFALSILITGGAYYLSQTEAAKGMAERAKKTGTMEQRFIVWRAGSEMIRDNFFLGVGFAQFPKVSGSYIKDYLPPEALPAHNNFIKVFAESGVFGFLTFFIFLVTLFLTKAREIYESDYFWIYTGVLSIVIMGMTIPSLHHKDYWFSLALLSYVIWHFYSGEEAKEHHS